MSLSPKVCGVVCLAFGAISTGYTWYTAHNEGSFALTLCLFGPALIVVGLAFLILPVTLLIVPKKIDGKLDYGLRNPTYTTTGKLVFLLGFVASGLYYLYLKYGLGA